MRPFKPNTFRQLSLRNDIAVYRHVSEILDFRAINSSSLVAFSNFLSLQLTFISVFWHVDTFVHHARGQATTPVFASERAGALVDVRRAKGFLPLPRPIALTYYFCQCHLPLPRPSPLPLYFSEYNCLPRAVTPSFAKQLR